MPYWFNDPALKTLVPLAGASAVLGLSAQFNMPHIVMGANVLAEQSALGAGIADTLAAIRPTRRAFLVTDNVARRYAEGVASLFQHKGFATETWDKAVPEAPMESVFECAQAMKRFEPDTLIAVGGGSVIDNAKAAWILYERPDITDLGQISPLTPLMLRKKAILVAIPTTSGTGSECTGASVLSETATHRKVPISNGELLPDYAILVPAFAMGMPPKLTAGTGMDALSHAMDNIMSPTTSDFADAFSLRAIKLIFTYLPRAYRDGTEHEARYKMHIAATMAGVAFGNGGVTLTHSFGHTVGKMYNVHHGIAVGMFIPYALQFYAPVSDKYMDMCEALHIRGKTKEAALAGLVKKVRTFMTGLDVPLALKDLGISRADFERDLEKLTLYSFEDPSALLSCRPVSMAQCEKVLRYAYDGKDIDF